MSKYVKELQMNSLRRQLDGVTDIVVADVIGLNSKESHNLRVDLRKKGISIEVVQNNLARKVLGELGMPPMDEMFKGASAVLWGGEGIVELAREATDFAKKIEKLQLKGVCLSGEALVGADKVESVGKLPSRVELIGQIINLFTSPAGQVVSQATGPGGQVVSQIQSIAEKEEAAAPAA